VNVQGDEPDMPGILVDQVAQLLMENQGTSVATACCSLDDREQYHDPSVVKVVADQSGHAIYFSRSPIPHYQPTGEPGSEAVPWSHIRRHIGIYAYRLAYLSVFTGRPSCPPEELEKLEQLRVLWHGDKIAVCEAQAAPGPGVDTVEDLERAILLFQGQG
jgi:3-deoxy-manno-octulosonate cytidylyltransferase (CMP-KDO synthetase)